MLYTNDQDLERSTVVANCTMNRERDLVGTNGYVIGIGLSPIDYLKGKATDHGSAAWLDFCCGSGKALVSG